MLNAPPLFAVSSKEILKHLRLWEVKPRPPLKATEPQKTLEYSFEGFIRPSFGVFQGEPMRIKVWFSPDVAGYIKEKLWHKSQQIHPQADGSIIFENEVAGADEIKFWIMSWGFHALVLEPDALRDEIRTETDRMAGSYNKMIADREEVFRSDRRGL